MLFCVTTRGRDRIFSNPRDSAIVRSTSMRTLLLALTNCRPLVGLVTPKLENKGICVPLALPPPPVTMYCGFEATPAPTLVGVVPTFWTPPTADGVFPQPNPSCVP